VSGSRECGIAQTLENLAYNGTLVDRALGQRLILIHMDRFAGIQRPDLSRPEGMPDINHAFFDRDDGRFVVIVHADIESGAPYGNHGSGCDNSVVIGLPAQFLDVYFHPTDQNIQQIAPVSRILAEDNIGVRIDLETAPI
jgi:hypothetical protein